jgi:nucleotide-binding universal stress UspA family protein
VTQNPEGGILDSRSLREIVVPVDGSELAAKAFAPAQAVAMATGAGVRLVTTAWDHEVDEADAYLRRLARRAEVPVDTEVVLDRDPVHTVVLHAKREESLVCMATHGRSGIGHAVLGSVTEAVLRAAPRPLLLVGPHLETRLSALEPPNLLVGVERDDLSEAVVDVAATWAKALRLSTRVVEVAMPSAGPVLLRTTDEASAHVDRLVDRLRALGVDANACVVHGTDPAENLVDEATRWPATMAVVGTRGRTGVGRFALGSVAMKFVRTSPCPVLVVPPGAAATAKKQDVAG